MSNEKRLIAELLQDVRAKGFWLYSSGEEGHEMTAEDIADYLAENGVTIQRWIPVTERLPEELKPVLTLNEEGYFSECGRWTGRRWETTWEFEDLTGVTHWMPLPEPPKEVPNG